MKKALHAFKIIKNLRRKKVFLFLDFDGTLSPIAERPADAYLPEKTRAILRKTATLKNVRTVIISGRPLKEVEKMTGVPGIIYAGNHGMEIKGKEMDFIMPLSKVSINALKKASAEISGKLKKIPGIIIEHKKMSVSYHYRLAGIRKKAAVENAIIEAAGKYINKGLLNIIKGKMVYELIIDEDWDKGKAVLWMLGKAKGQNPAEDAVVVYIGDDRTDFYAFRALKGRGITVFVGPHARMPKAAGYYLKSTLETAVFLRALVAMKDKEKR